MSPTDNRRLRGGSGGLVQLYHRLMLLGDFGFRCVVQQMRCRLVQEHRVIDPDRLGIHGITHPDIHLHDHTRVTERPSEPNAPTLVIRSKRYRFDCDAFRIVLHPVVLNFERHALPENLGDRFGCPGNAAEYIGVHGGPHPRDLPDTQHQRAFRHELVRMRRASEPIQKALDGIVLQ